MSERLKSRKSERSCASSSCRPSGTRPSAPAWSPVWCWGLIQVESGFRKYAISSVGARGAQVMPFWTRVIGDGDASRLFHMQSNLRFGCVILRHPIPDRENGDLF